MIRKTPRVGKSRMVAINSAIDSLKMEFPTERAEASMRGTLNDLRSSAGVVSRPAGTKRDV